jgi:PKD repeat protein
LSNSGIWTGAGVVGSTFNPDLSGTGSIVLTYNTSSQPSGLCPAQSTLAVKVYSVATPFIEEEGPYCNSQAPIKLRVNPIGGIFTGMNNNAVDVLGHFAPSAALIGDNIINYSITAGPCVAYGQTVIKIEKFISADFSKQPGPYCRNEKAIDFNSLVQNPGGAFSGPGLSGSLFTPKNANIGNNNIIVYQTHSWPTASLCPHTTTVRVQVNNTPDVQITSTRNEGCLPVEVLFNTPSVNSGKGEWTLGDGSEPEIGLTVNHTYTASGTYSVVFNYWDNLGCVTQATLGTPVKVHELPKAAFSYGPYNEDLTISNPEVHFTNLSSDLKNNTYEWKMDNLPDTKEIEPVVTFPTIGRYEITLTATNIHS